MSKAVKENRLKITTARFNDNSIYIRILRVRTKEIIEKVLNSIALWPHFTDMIDTSQGYVPLLGFRILVSLKQLPPPVCIHFSRPLFVFNIYSIFQPSSSDYSDPSFISDRGVLLLLLESNA